MKAFVVYDSFFGNTEQIARAIGSSLGDPQEVGVLKVGEVQPEQLVGLELLIVGSPTRGFRPSPAISDFLKKISNNSLQGIHATAFDTRIANSEVGSPILRTLVKIGGYAAEPIADRLKKKGASLIVSPQGFFVKASEGPLKEGELERAASWASQIDAARKLNSTPVNPG